MLKSPLLMLRAILCLLLLASGGPTSAETKDKPKPIRALLITGGCCHDYTNQKDILTKGISARSAVPIDWTIVQEGDKREHKHSIYGKPEWWKGYDVVVHDECFGFVEDDAFVEGIVKAHTENKVPLVAIHCAVHSYRKAKTRAWSEMLGIRSEAHGPRNDIAVAYTAKDHPITKGLKNWVSPMDELYNNLKVYEKTTPLATGKQGDVEAVVAWTNEYHGTRVFVTTLGHANETVGSGEYLELVTRGLQWAVGRSD
jgi:type 1 glutamine amidotransferase